MLRFRPRRLAGCPAGLCVLGVAAVLAVVSRGAAGQPLDESPDSSPSAVSWPGVSPLPVVRGQLWRFLKGRSEPPPGWNTIAFGDSTWASGPSGFGYGDGDDATLLGDMQNGYLSVYTRKLFHVPDPAAVAALEMTVDWDDGFVAFVNGQEVARRNLGGGPGTFVPHTAIATDHEASAGVNGGIPEKIAVPRELLLSGINVIAVQGHNSRIDSTDLSLLVELRSVVPPPAPPTNVAPSDRAINVRWSPRLCVSVAEPARAGLLVTFYGREVTAPESRDFTVIALPDTQFYSASLPETYLAQTRWIVENRAERNIAFVTQLGDCVDEAQIESQWINADSAWSLVEDPVTTGLTEGVPFGIAVGNHDQYPAGVPGTLAEQGATTVAYNEWFGTPRFADREYYGGHFGTNNDNHFQLFRAGGMDFLVIHMEFMATDTPLRRAVLDWADDLLKLHRNRRAIISSHYLMEGNGSNAFSNQGAATYEALKDNPNLFLMLCGHLDIAQHRLDVFEGNVVHTLRSDYQRQPNGGNGWLRILTFRPDADILDVETYSPTLGQHLDDPLNRFTLAYDMQGGQPFSALGAATPSGGDRVCLSWPGRRLGRTYEWYAVVSDGAASTAGPRSTFTAGERRRPNRLFPFGRSTGVSGVGAD